MSQVTSLHMMHLKAATSNVYMLTVNYRAAYREFSPDSQFPSALHRILTLFWFEGQMFNVLPLCCSKSPKAKLPTSW